MVTYEALFAYTQTICNILIVIITATTLFMNIKKK